MGVQILVDVIHGK